MTHFSLALVDVLDQGQALDVDERVERDGATDRDGLGPDPGEPALREDDPVAGGGEQLDFMA